MFVDHVALWMRIPKENMDIGPKGCMEKLLSGLTRYNISGLGLSGGWVEDVYVIVIMGGSLSFMRNVYRRILANEDFCALLCKDRPFIENNRLAKMPELESFGMVDENGAFLGGNCCFGLTVR